MVMREMIQNVVTELLNPVFARISNMILIGTIEGVNIKADGTQFLDIETFAGNVEPNVRHWLPFGLFINPKPGSQVIVLHVSGNRSIALALPVFGNTPAWGASGDSGLYNDKGMQIRLIASGIEFYVANVLVGTLTASGLQIVGNVSAAGLAVSGGMSAGSVTSTGDVKAGAVSLLTHVHPGVTPGPGSTGPPV